MGLRNVASDNLKDDDFIAVFILFAFQCLKRVKEVGFYIAFK